MADAMDFRADFKTERDALSAAASIAHSLSQQLSDLDIQTTQFAPPSDIDTMIPPLILSVPPEILEPLSTLTVSENARNMILERFGRFVAELQKEYTSAYRHSCMEVYRVTGSISDMHALHKAYQALSQRRMVPTIKSQVDFILAEAKKHSKNPVQDTKRHFNSQFTHVLEKYFEQNGYPSSLHRSVLAQKSGMTPRQIEVWFQNHRKRAKQDGKIIRRLDSDLPLKRALELLSRPLQVYQRLPLPLVNEPCGTSWENNKRADTQSESSEVTSVLSETDSIEIRPPHAFPTRRSDQYPDPFPTDKGAFTFPSPIWRRTPATTSIIPTAVDIDDFSRQFHMKLNFVNNSWKRDCTPTKSEVFSSTPWFAPLRTIPPSAPLSSLQQPRSLAGASTSMLTSTIAKDPFTFVFPKPGQMEQRDESNITCIVRLPVGPKQSSSSVTERIHRSVDALDRERKGLRMRPRTPHSSKPSTSRLDSHGEIAGRKGTPTSRRGPSNLQTFGSRTSSFTSDTSSSDDTSSPSTPPSFPDYNLHPDLVVGSDDLAGNLDSYEVTPSPSFDFTLSKFPTDTQPSSPQIFDLTFTSPMNTNAGPLSSRTFDFIFPNKVADRQPSALHQNHTPLICT
uniref:Homeobox domain-containing protein n=1 Tax=Psilocybe cubensis TaxID=181762 RepID=A0A8H7YAP0_PSICU